MLPAEVPHIAHQEALDIAVVVERAAELQETSCICRSPSASFWKRM